MHKKYLTYLFKHYRMPLVFIGLLFMGISLTPYLFAQRTDAFQQTATTEMSLMVCLTYVLPVLLFAFVHRKRSVDLFFSLPISRKQQLPTNLLFAFVVIYGCFTITTILAYLLQHTYPLSRLVLLFVVMAFLVIALLVIHSAIYLLANNIFDGIVLLGAYSLFFLLVYAMFGTFISTLVAGGRSWFFNLDRLLFFANPLYCLGSLFSVLIDVKYVFSWKNDYLMVVIPVVYLLLAIYLLKVHFIERKTERAEQLSDYILAYPVVIHIYLFAILMTLAAELVQSLQVRNMIVYYLLILLIYIISTFVYRRKLQLQPKYFITYALATAISIAFAFVAWNTRGFGLAEQYTLQKGNYISYEYHVDGIDENDLTKQVSWDLYGDHAVSLNLTCLIPISEMDQYQEEIDFFETYRKENIDAYYEREEGYDAGYFGVMNYTGSNRDGIVNEYYYKAHRLFTEEELIQLSDHVMITIYRYSDDQQFTLQEFLEQNRGGNHDTTQSQ